MRLSSLKSKKFMKAVHVILLAVISLFLSTDLLAQRNHHHRGGGRVVVVRHSRFRPRRVVVFRPAWHPRLTCQRRWVYFPRYNFYWDNWRNHYLYFNGTVWISKADPPASTNGVALANEKYYELEEADDDNDDIAVANSQHNEKYGDKN
jgi:hypothetical protein